MPQGSSDIQRAKGEGSKLTPGRLWKPGPGGRDSDPYLKLDFQMGQLLAQSAPGLVED